VKGVNVTNNRRLLIIDNKLCAILCLKAVCFGLNCRLRFRSVVCRWNALPLRASMICKRMRDVGAVHSCYDESGLILPW
jgi:hypothetical protein